MPGYIAQNLCSIRNADVIRVILVASLENGFLNMYTVSAHRCLFLALEILVHMSVFPTGLDVS